MFDQLINTIRTGLIEIAATITLALLSLAAAYAVSYIRRAQAALEARTQAEIVDRMIARAAALAESTVWALESTVAKEVRRAVQEGVKSREELMAIGQRAVDDVLKHLETEGQKVLEAAVGDVRDFVRDLVEAHVERLKGRTLDVPFASSPANSDVPASS